MSGDMKKRCVEVLQAFVASFQARKEDVTMDLVKQFMDPTRRLDYMNQFPPPAVQKTAAKEKTKKTSKTNGQ
jgi:hypothetical protein